MNFHKNWSSLAWLLGGMFLVWLAGDVSGQTNRLNVAVNAEQIICSGDDRDLDCSVFLDISGNLASNAVAITDVRVRQATDDTGKDLTKGAAGLTSGAVPSTGGWRQMLRLKCPSPTAQMIANLQGEMDLAIPTTENGGRVIVENFMAHPGEIIRDARLEQYGIRLTFHTFESYVDFQRAHPKPYVVDADLRVEKNCFSGSYGNQTNPPRNSVAFKIDDPQKKLITMVFETASGAVLPVEHANMESSYRSYHFAAPLPPGLKLVVLVATPGVIQTESFSMQSVRLPWNR